MKLEDYLQEGENRNPDPTIEEVRRMYADKFQQLTPPENKGDSMFRDLYNLILHLQERISELENRK